MGTEETNFNGTFEKIYFLVSFPRILSWEFSRVQCSTSKPRMLILMANPEVLHREISLIFVFE